MYIVAVYGVSNIQHFKVLFGEQWFIYLQSMRYLIFPETRGVFSKPWKKDNLGNDIPDSIDKSINSVPIKSGI